MTTIGGHNSPSLPAKGEMVGIGARRKNICHADASCHTNKSFDETAQGEFPRATNEEHAIFSMTTIQDSGWMKNNYRKREKRHVYHDIVPLKKEERKNGVIQVFHDGNDEQANLFSISESSASQLENKVKTTKPAIPPKPHYVLRDKRLRHVYQTIQSSNTKFILPPPLPDKPDHLRRSFKGAQEQPPPLPPRVANPEAIKRRHKLDQEYFENLKKNVDEDLLGLAEEGDLPVTQQNTSMQEQNTRRLDYGAHSPPAYPEVRERQLPSLPGMSPRRHSLPLYESIAENENPNTSNETFPQTRLSFVGNDDMAAGSDTNSLKPESEWKVSSQAKIAQNLQLLKRCGWYWGNMTWQEAEMLLAQKEGEGVFLMRDSQNPLHLLTITVRSTTNTVHHIRVEYSEGKFQLYEPGRTVSRSAAQCVRHSNIEQFIKLAIKHSTSGSFLYFLKPKNMGEPPVQIRLLTPISRLMKVKTLQYICRMAIRDCATAELISSVSVPVRIRQYLQEGPYYDPREEL